MYSTIDIKKSLHTVKTTGFCDVKNLQPVQCQWKPNLDISEKKNMQIKTK